MTTVEEAIQRVQSLYSKGVQSKDTRLTERHIYSCLISARSTVLQQKANKKQFLSSWNYQTIPCVELEDAPIHDCPCAPKGTLMLRSKYKLPKPITSLDKPLINPITTLDNSFTFDKAEYNTYKHNKGKKYTSTRPFYIYYNDYLFIGVSKRIKAVPVTGIFHDPVEAGFYPSACEECADCGCRTPYEMGFYIDGDLLRPITQLANQELIILFKQMGEDKTNDASDNNDVKGAMVHQPDDGQ